mgnify:CR=1 FL=1
MATIQKKSFWQQYGGLILILGGIAIGAIIGGVICVILALLTGDVWWKALIVGAYILVVQQLDGNIIQPRIVGHTVGVRPIYVLLAITVGGGLFGFWGIFLGVPVMATVQMFLNDLIAYRNRTRAAAVPDVQYLDGAGLPLHGHALAGQLIEGLAVELDCRIHGRMLQQTPAKTERMRGKRAEREKNPGEKERALRLESRGASMRMGRRREGWTEGYGSDRM